jgi:hypothetical protein
MLSNNNPLNFCVRKILYLTLEKNGNSRRRKLAFPKPTYIKLKTKIKTI